MQVSIEAAEGLERRLTVSLPADQFNKEIKNRIKQTAQRARIDGFRPGKVPTSVIKQRYGKGIQSEVLQETIQKSLGEALAQEKVNPAGLPSIEKVSEDFSENIEYTAVYEVFPDVTLSEFDGYSFVTQTTEITSDDVETMLTNLQTQRATYNDVERAAKLTDQLTLNFVGKVDGEEFENGSANDAKLVLGSGQMIPGFEDALVGVCSGEEKTINVTFPEDYQSEDLKGKEATFDISVSNVAEQVLSELNEEFFKDFGAKATELDGFKTEVKENMQREADNAVKARLKNTVIEQLLADNELLVPSALVKDEIGRLKQEAIQQFGQGAKLDASALPDDMFKAQAEKRVQIGLLINEVIKVNEISADDEQIDAYLEKMASVYQDPQSVIDYYKNNAEQLNSVKAIVLEEAAINMVVSKATTAEESISYEQAIAK